MVEILALLAVLLSGAGLFSYLTLKKTRRNRKLQESGAKSQRDQKYCFIINPSKKNAQQHEKTIATVCEEEGIKNFYFKYTTIEHPGNQQAVDAVSEGADVVVACGGDGTIRSVCCGIVKSGLDTSLVDVGVIPLGTGNVLAHNIHLPLGDTAAATKVAVYAKSRAFDIGMCNRKEDNGFEHAFTVIAGVGFDANMVVNTNQTAKKIVGPLAYYAAGVREGFRKKPTVEMEVVAADSKVTRATTKLRTVMVGNCGRIPGFNLIPGAQYNDGILDVAAVDTTAGLLGWMQLGADVTLQNFGLKTKSKYKIGRIDHIQAKSVHLKIDSEQSVQLDGDIIGQTTDVEFRIIKNAVNLRFL
ncbi:MAG: hypothetical protein LBQ41_04065 [Candidatus Ancillula sp.]|jgi:diacylglycerol kinase family enzyme|nr:hypothetical protein [Candidatus Ancillula sp.]